MLCDISFAPCYKESSLWLDMFCRKWIIHFPIYPHMLPQSHPLVWHVLLRIPDAPEVSLRYHPLWQQNVWRKTDLQGNAPRDFMRISELSWFSELSMERLAITRLFLLRSKYLHIPSLPLTSPPAPRGPPRLPTSRVIERNNWGFYFLCIC
jgi:hypothetical protein